ncbi:MarR family winged helix-turn-helix transcriptional regulator [Dactylosporangium sucinum]|uniref:MarR family transcriptional regulator n=1 Tax=Dactylosporangium sucinum TaxID=1424081 RepID=A0A917TLW7_9ACTN|nr:MarR family winged helix-turn-helix transcriptional regulator [Dactylosporangium sucinum]GGM27371.1 MarR family transcriptional regulator [Dactylosporangium sucinum]
MQSRDALAAIEVAMVTIRRRQTRRALARDGVDPALFDVVDAVEAREPAEATVMTVAAALGVAQPRASKLVAAAVEAGLLRREADQADGRRSLLVRTVAGRELSDRVHESRRARFAAATAGWTPAERATFAQLLTRFVDGLTETAAERH